MSAYFDCERPLCSCEQELVEVRDDGSGKADWTNVEAIVGGFVELVPGGRPSLHPQGDLQGLTRRYFLPSHHYPVRLVNPDLPFKCSADELLRYPMQPLQSHFHDTSSSQRDRDMRAHHPTNVREYTEFEGEAQETVKDVLKNLEKEGYRRIGFEASGHERSETDTVIRLYECGAERVNELMEKNGADAVFGSHPSNRPTNSQVAEASGSQQRQMRVGGLLHRKDKHGKKISPDIYCAPTQGHMRQIVQVTEVKPSIRLKNLDKIPGHFVTVWNIAVKGHCQVVLTPEQLAYALDNKLQSNVKTLVSQITHYCASYGLKTGLISTYQQTWAVKFVPEELELTMLVSDAIQPDTDVDALGTRLTTTPEAFLWSLSRGQQEPRIPFNTAQAAGKAVRTTQEQRQEYWAPTPGPGASEGSSSTSGTTRSGAKYTTRSSSPILVEYNLGPGSWFGRYGLLDAVYRIGESEDSIKGCQIEAMALRKLRPLQGILVPELLWTGFIDSGEYVNITRYYEAQKFSFMDTGKHDQLRVAARQLHEHGVVHSDLDTESNILILPDGTLMIVDFDLANVDPATNDAENELARVEAECKQGQMNANVREKLLLRGRLPLIEIPNSPTGSPRKQAKSRGSATPQKENVG